METSVPGAVVPAERRTAGHDSIRRETRVARTARYTVWVSIEEDTDFENVEDALMDLPGYIEYDFEEAITV